MKMLNRNLKIILGDLPTLWIMVTVAACVGFVDNVFQDTPLPLIYVSKEDRILQAVERIAQNALEGKNLAAEDTEDAERNGHDVSFSASSEVHLVAVHNIDLATFREMQGQALILDARPEIFHRLGRVPKAVSLPRDDFEVYYTKQRVQLEKHKALPVAIYCTGGSCEDGEMVAAALIRLGFAHVYLFRGGWHEWTRAKLPEEKSL